MIENSLRGAAAGIAGTAAMTVFMRPGLGRLLPPGWRPDEWVPRQVVQWLETFPEPSVALDRPAESAAAAIAHLGYGASMGALFGIVRGRGSRVPPAAAGAAWGMLVWAAGYEGWMPAAGVRPMLTHQPPTKWPLPIFNHLVFGVVTALVHDGLTRRSRPARREIRVRV